MGSKEIVKEFSKNAGTYGKYNTIQKQVAKKLISLVKNKPKKIIDLGSGSGELYKLVDWELEKFLAVDISKNMCSLHPKEKNVKVLNIDYEKDKLYENILKDEEFDIVFSSSSLQWSKNLEKMVKNFSDLSKNCAVSLFCNQTFKTIYDNSHLDSFLPDYKRVIEIFSQFYDINYKREFYKLYFDDNISKFRYIKKSGVSGGKRRLNYADTKKLIENYPIDYLEFEVLYLTGVVHTR